VLFGFADLGVNVLGDVFGKNSQVPNPVEASEITDIIDFL